MNSSSPVALGGKQGNLLSCRVPTSRHPGDELNSLQLLLDQVPHKIYGCCMRQSGGRILDAIVFLSLQAHTTLTWKGSVSACCSFLCVPTNLWAYTWGFITWESHYALLVFFSSEILLQQSFFSTCMFFCRLNIFKLATFFSCWFVWNRLIWQLFVSLYFFCLSHRLFIPSGSRSGIDTY